MLNSYDQPSDPTTPAIQHPHDQPSPNHTNSFTQPLPLDTAKHSVPASTLVAAQHRASQRSVTKKICLITTVFLICLVGLTFAFLSFICLFHQCRISKGSVESTAPLGRVLTISQVTSHVAPLSLPIVMGLFSYLLSVEWLRSSVNAGVNRPSPSQLGLLISMCDGAGIASIVSSIRYIFQKPRDGHPRVAAPPILRQSIIFLGSLLAITYITAGADSWLHASSASIIITSLEPYNSATPPNFGREINATACLVASQNQIDGSSVSNPKLAASCGLLSSTVHGVTTELGEGIRLIDNSSTIHRMVFTNDQIAIVIPLNTPENITYSAKTLGVKSQCATITKECLTPTVNSDGSLTYGSSVHFDCSKSGFVLPTNDTSNSGGPCSLDSQGNCTEWDTISSNPFNAAGVSTSLAFISPDIPIENFYNNTGWFIDGQSNGWNVVLCTIYVLDVTYTYQSSRYTTLSSTPATLNTTRAIAAPLFQIGQNQGTPTIEEAVDGAGLNNNPPYELVYSYELSRQMLGGAGYIYAPSNVLDVHSEVQIVGSRLKLIPLIIFVASLVIFGCEVLYTSFRIIIVTWSAHYVDLAALHLNNPLTAVQRLYGHLDPTLSWEVKASKRFGVETEEDRLRIGTYPVTGDPKDGSIFWVTKG